MLSVLIPTYNTDIFPLASALKKQCDAAGIAYEIIVLDDGSPDKVFDFENARINDFENCLFIKNTFNSGRLAARNQLAQKAQYDWLLFLDADTFPPDGHFIQRYVGQIQKVPQVCSGGITYEAKQPGPDKILRWTYGRKREAIPAAERNKKPQQLFLSANYVIQKTLYLQYIAPIEHARYGTDLLIQQVLNQKGIAVTHTDNPVLHLGLEPNEIFLSKSLDALETLHMFSGNADFPERNSKLLTAFLLLKKFRLQKVYGFFFTRFEKSWRNNLLGKKPSLFIFDLYKLGYFCNLK